MFVVSFVAATFFFLSLKILPPTVLQSEDRGIYRAQAERYVALISENKGFYMLSARYLLVLAATEGSSNDNTNCGLVSMWDLPAILASFSRGNE